MNCDKRQSENIVTKAKQIVYFAIQKKSEFSLERNNSMTSSW